MASFGATLAATHAWAADDGEDTARLLSFGGMCLNCELSGRKLPEAKFIGANFSGASMVGSDLHGSAFFGSNFAGADLAKADLHGATLFSSDFTNTDFTEANLAGVHGHGDNFYGANLTRFAKLSTAPTCSDPELGRREPGATPSSSALRCSAPT